MNALVRRLAFSLVLTGALMGGLAVKFVPAAAQSCDPSYPDFCIPPPYEVGDLDCLDIQRSGFRVLAPDPHFLDSDVNGFGC